jgi:hypothetical protein
MHSGHPAFPFFMGMNNSDRFLWKRQISDGVFFSRRRIRERRFFAIQ